MEYRRFRRPEGLPRIWNVPFPSNPHFAGRGRELDELHDRLTRQSAATITQPQAVHGLGGVGKTQLAVQYAWQHRAAYDAVLWVGADSPESLDANLAALSRADVLGLPEADAKEQPVQTAAVLHWLHQNPCWLLILDSVDSREAAAAVSQLLGTPLPGHVIVTSRSSDLPLEVFPLALDSLPDDAAADFLLARTEAGGFQPGPRVDALALARELGGLPLALEQAAAYLLRHGATFAAYIGCLQAIRPQLLRQETAGAARYPRSAAETWLVTEKELGVAARALLRLAAFLAPDDIPRALADRESQALCAAVPALAGEEKTQPARPAGPLDTEAALVELADHSMITLEPTTFSCHRLVQAVQSDRLTDELRLRWTGLAARWVNEAVALNTDDVRSWRAMEALRSHIETVVVHADRLAIAVPTGRLMNQLGLFLYAKSLHREAEPLMRRVIAILEKSLGENHPNVATSLNNLAALLLAVGQPDEAEPLMHRHVIIFRRFGESTGSEHPHMRSAVGNYRALLEEMGLPAQEIRRRVREAAGRYAGREIQGS